MRRIEEILPPHTPRAWPALSALRPQVPHPAALVQAVDGVQRAQGYRLVGAFESAEAGVHADADAAAEADSEAEADADANAEPQADAMAVAGFRVLHTLAWGVTLYVDDLSTVEASRGHGHARALLHWLEGEADRLGCDELHLDSGVGPARHAAHRLYLNQGLAITAHHFSRRTGGPQW